LHSKLKIEIPENSSLIKYPENVLFCGSCKRAISPEYKKAAEECNYRCAECRPADKESVDKQALKAYSRYCSKKPKELNLYREKDEQGNEKYILLCDNCFKAKYEQRRKAVQHPALFRHMPIKNVLVRILLGILICSFGAFALAIPGIVLLISAGFLFKLLGFIILIFGAAIFVYGLEMIKL
jgi:hypothetical protein